MITEIFEKFDGTALIDKCVDYIIDKYIEAGGRKEDANREITLWSLEGIYHREGKQGLASFMENWKPVPKKHNVIRGGYAG